MDVGEGGIDGLNWLTAATGAVRLCRSTGFQPVHVAPASIRFTTSSLFPTNSNRQFPHFRHSPRVFHGVPQDHRHHESDDRNTRLPEWSRATRAPVRHHCAVYDFHECRCPASSCPGSGFKPHARDSASRTMPAARTACHRSASESLRRAWRSRARFIQHCRGRRRGTLESCRSAVRSSSRLLAGAVNLHHERHSEYDRVRRTPFIQRESGVESRPGGR